ncbi:hypothetical protein MOQ72_34040 [Saccharopolyspora sp. K220]|uniref:hypothetical protein n=1 Tax=Saccharopolyspora soli TaxID=2926618 RepID=UPI001F57F2FA|nr:hypothetical protein [Saccharopolyspora soli]MCI2422462.1 hypothetical protein [Saccharopolyspora soli]
MERDFCSHVLAEVWDALARIRPGDGELSLTERELVTAVSTDGRSLRILLRLPATLWRTGAQRELLPEIEAAVRTAPALHDVRTSVKVYRPPLAEHHDCVRNALSGLHAKGWRISGIEQRPNTAGLDRSGTVRVIVEARVRQRAGEAVSGPLRTA